MYLGSVFGNIIVPVVLSVTVLSLYLPLKISGLFLVPSLYFAIKNGCFDILEQHIKVLFAVFFLYVLIFTVISSDHSSSVKGLYDLVRGGCFFLIGLFFAKKMKNPKFCVFVSCFSIILIIGNLFFLQRESFFGYHENPNNTAFMLVFLLSFVVPLLIGEKKIKGSSFYLLISGTGVCAYLIFLTNSRGAALGVLGALLVCFAFKEQISNKLRIFIAAVVFSLGGAVFIFSRIKGFDLSGREGLWSGLIEATISERPFFGYGINTVKNVIKENELITLIAHNIFVENFVSTGIIGISLFSMIVFFTIKYLFSLEYNRSSVFFVGVFGLSAFLIIGMFDLKFSSFRFSAIISFFLALIYSQRIIKN